MVCYTRKNKTPFQIDEEDLGMVLKHSWWIIRDGYIGTWMNGKTVSIHQILMNTPKGMLVDHINGDKKDNRKSNLRICTGFENQHNRKKQAGSSKYKGVSWHKRDLIWNAYIALNNKKIFLGYFEDEREAALAYNEAALKYHGEFARLNIIDETKDA